MRGVFRSTLRLPIRFDSFDGGPIDPGDIPFEETIHGDPVNPAFEAIEVTAEVASTPVDGLVSIGSKYDDAYLNILGAENLLTYFALEEHTDDERTYTIGPWLASHPGGPHVHVLQSDRSECDAVIVEATNIDRFGAPQYQAFDGSTNYTYDLSSLAYKIAVTAGESLHIIGNFRLNNLGTEETLFSLHGDGVTNDFVMFRKSATNVISGQIFIDGAANAASSLSAGAYDLDTGGNNTDWWFSLELFNGPTQVTYKMRTAIAGDNRAVSVTPVLAQFANFAQFIDRLILGSRPDASLKVQSGGRDNRFVVYRNLPDGLISDADWDTIRGGAVDPGTFYPRSFRHCHIIGRDPYGHRNAIDGQLYTASAGTPTLSTASTPVDIPVDAKWTGPVITINATTSSVQHSAGIPCDGLWELTTESGKAAASIGLQWGDNPTATLASPSQVITGARNSFCGRGDLLAVIADQAVKIKIFPLYGAAGP